MTSSGTPPGWSGHPLTTAQARSAAPRACKFSSPASLRSQNIRGGVLRRRAQLVKDGRVEAARRRDYASDPDTTVRDIAEFTAEFEANRGGSGAATASG